MLIKGIDLPEILLLAQESGEIVVFAGAGVSCPPPSNLPLFDELASKIGENSGVKKDDGELMNSVRNSVGTVSFFGGAGIRVSVTYFCLILPKQLPGTRNFPIGCAKD